MKVMWVVVMALRGECLQQLVREYVLEESSVCKQCKGYILNCKLLERDVVSVLGII